ALALYEALARHEKEPFQAIGAAGSYCNLGNLAARQGKVQEALVLYDKAIAALEAVLAKEPRHARAREFLCSSLSGRGEALTSAAHHAEAVRDYERARESAPRTRQTIQAVLLAGAQCNLAHRVRDGGKVQEALVLYDKGIAALEAVLQKDPRHAEAREFLANSLRGRARAFALLGRHAESAQDFGRALEYGQSSLEAEV